MRFPEELLAKVATIGHHYDRSPFEKSLLSLSKQQQGAELDGFACMETIRVLDGLVNQLSHIKGLRDQPPGWVHTLEDLDQWEDELDPVAKELRSVRIGLQREYREWKKQTAEQERTTRRSRQ